MNSGEAARPHAPRDLNLLDTAPNEVFDSITRMACRVFNVPRAAISLTDEQRHWLKSRVGGDVEVAEDGAPFSEVTSTRAPLIVADLAADPRFNKTPLAQGGVRFYAGTPLITRDGCPLGAMCVMDVKPRSMQAAERELLDEFATMILSQIELQRVLICIDPISGLPNRHQFTQDLQHIQAGEERIALVYELAGTAQLAEAMRAIGPWYSDGLVNASVRAIKHHFGTGSQLYHVGSTQLATLISKDEWRSLDNKADSLLRVQQDINASGYAAGSGIAVGVAPFKVGDISSSEIIRAAWSAARDVRGRSRMRAYSPSSDLWHIRRHSILSGLHEAFSGEGQLSLYYQPRVEMRTGICCGVEALLRWNHPRLGSIDPNEFVPLAEQAGLAWQITEWVIGAASAQAAAWHRCGIRLRISANVSAINLEEPEFADVLLSALAIHGVPAGVFEIELTESALARDHSRIRNNLDQLREAGVSCAIDDFGTGYSAISYLQEFPVDAIKIDQSFIRLLSSGRRNRVLVRDMITMAHDLGHRVVAEGIENQEAYDFLARCSCEEAQGFLIARPMPAREFVTWLDANARGSRKGTSAR